MSKKKKYQVGGTEPTMEELIKLMETPQGKQLIDSYVKAGYTFEGIGDKGTANFSREIGSAHLPEWAQLLNVGALGVTGIANKISDVGVDRKYRKDMIEALQPEAYANFDEAGLNNLPVYAKYGADLQMPYGGGPLTAEGAKEILRDGKVNGKKLTAKQKRYFGYIAGGGKPKKATGGQAAPNAELEKGELYMTQNDTLNKIPESGDTHEEGGEVVPNVERVLEDTSDKRGDEASKALLLSPERAEALTGVPVSRSVSHSKALEKADEFYTGRVKKIEGKIRKNVDSVQQNPLNKYAHNSMDLNLKTLEHIPTSGELFDILFGHQEVVKDMHGIDQGSQKKYGWGGINPYPIDPYRNSKTVAGRTTPTSKSSLYNKNKEFLDQWEAIFPGISKWDNKKAQEAIYDYMLQSDEGKGKLSEMWRTYGLTNEGKKYSDLTKMTKNGVFDPTKELNDDQLAALKKAYVDGMFGARQVEPTAAPSRPGIEPIAPRITGKVADPAMPTDPRPETLMERPADPRGIRTQPKSRFNEPLRWYDVAGPLNNLLNSGRIPINYDSPQFNQIQLARQNPLPALQNAQTDFNTIVGQLDPTTGGGAANLANVFAKKYAIDNQVLGQYEGINNQIKNQEIQYNAAVRDKQSLADVGSRGEFERKYLLGVEAQRQQQAQSMDELYTRVAQNTRLNREGNLMMQMFPAFDQYAEYNGYNPMFRNPLAIASNNPFLPMPSAKTSTTRTTKTTGNKSTTTESTTTKKKNGGYTFRAK